MKCKWPDAGNGEPGSASCQLGNEPPCPECGRELMTALEFYAVTGQSPRDDDLQRANCEFAGEIGHHGCGICAPHGLPVFMCGECFRLANPERVVTPSVVHQ